MKENRRRYSCQDLAYRTPLRWLWVTCMYLEKERLNTTIWLWWRQTLSLSPSLRLYIKCFWNLINVWSCKMDVKGRDNPSYRSTPDNVFVYTLHFSILQNYWFIVIQHSTVPTNFYTVYQLERGDEGSSTYVYAEIRIRHVSLSIESQMECMLLLASIKTLIRHYPCTCLYALHSRIGYILKARRFVCSLASACSILLRIIWPIIINDN